MKQSLYEIYLSELGSIPEFLKKYLMVPSMLRLKNVCYFCGMDYASKNIYDFKEAISRYDHSLSVALIVWKYTLDQKATLAGLFHDVATPCFSHVIDYMNKDYAHQESTEEYTLQVMKRDHVLIEQLEKDGLDMDAIADFKRYSIVDNQRPKLCADRLDGVILTGMAWTRSLRKKDIVKIIHDLEVYINEDNELELGFRNADIAQLVVETSELIDIYCHSNEDNYMMELLAKITRMAIENNIITYEELYYLSEIEFFHRIECSSSEEILKSLDKFKNIKKEDIPFVALDGVKRRCLNPLVGGNRFSR